MSAADVPPDEAPAPAPRRARSLVLVNTGDGKGKSTATEMVELARAYRRGIRATKGIDF